MSKAGWEKSFRGAWDAFIRDRCRCVYCGFEGTTFESWLTLVPDHLVPVHVGGKQCTQNLVVACARCNSFKKAYDPSHGTLKSAQSEEEREQLIADARDKIKSSRTRLEAEQDFQEMKSEIAARK